MAKAGSFITKFGYLAVHSRWFLELPIGIHQRKRNKVFESKTGPKIGRFFFEMYKNQWAGPKFLRFVFCWVGAQKVLCVSSLITTAKKWTCSLFFLQPTIRNLFATLLQPWYLSLFKPNWWQQPLNIQYQNLKHQLQFIFIMCSDFLIFLIWLPSFLIWSTILLHKPKSKWSKLFWFNQLCKLVGQVWRHEFK